MGFMLDSGEEEHHDIVIIGGGICGLATALALVRKGFKSIVLERSDALRATGVTIGVQANGWCALEQLGVASPLRQTALALERIRDIWIDEGKQQDIPLLNSETRCLKRSDLVNTLADALPSGTLRLGCQVVSIQLDSEKKCPVVQLQNGTSIHAKVLLGCDGSRSVVADFLGLNPPGKLAVSVIRGLSNYANGHSFPLEVIRARRGNVMFGRLPVTDNLVYWFITLPSGRSDEEFPHDPKLIKQIAIESVSGFPADVRGLIQSCDLESLSFAHLRHRPPWELILQGKFRKGTVTVAGDAMHVMGPFLGQGGSAALEDAVVFARNLTQKTSPLDLSRQSHVMIRDKVEEAMDRYLKERRTRVIRLSTQVYLIGVLLTKNVTVVKKIVIVILMVMLFKDSNGHTLYDCGRL